MVIYPRLLKQFLSQNSQNLSNTTVVDINLNIYIVIMCFLLASLFACFSLHALAVLVHYKHNIFV